MSRGWSVIALAMIVAGCEVDAYCVACPDPIDGGAVDAARDARASGDDAEIADDAGECVPTDGAVELCNELDDDCDDLTDEGFDLENDPTNCGECGTQCRFPNAEGECASGACVVTACFDGFVDLDDVPGCEYACPVFPTQGEECNGFDDDCDGVVDETLPAPPPGLCRTTPGTPCAGVVPTCTTREGRTTWFCDYPANVEFDPVVPNGIVLEETRCDGEDGDCDGLRDESFAALGDACDNGGRGACRDAGEIACDPADASRTICDLGVAPDPVPGAPLAEICNGVDDDCDGTIDDSDPSDAGRVRDDMVQITRGATTFWIYRHEASRPDSSASAGGTSSARACGRAGVLPWTSIGYDEAAAACAAAGHRLCTAAEWRAACEGASGRDYPYGDTYEAATCNGADRDAVAGGAIDSRLEPTGALAMCVSEEGVLDMSGNAKEWTADQRGSASGGGRIFVVRGGSHESPQLGLTCTTELSRATEDTLLGTLGFRCCDSDGP
ncbi:formylglycine-generating enzyme family protein [Sandaracinus amylolyticus]|uniref:formylglycine-generating enzyme family protein n=1 Tax=Sandaracinus amylolyticus TaxID=927083 RepID=UPI001F4170EC|nr:SUMF1/EgtB/PvdO family nonheme iron enzyme [Sandaracinus amylolyticus]UJR83855.1 Hypothetical protein I5071_59260 [Sandaracinus amylolyticus]